MNDQHTLRRQLKLSLAEHGVTVTAFAKDAGISQPTLHRFLKERPGYGGDLRTDSERKVRDEMARRGWATEDDPNVRVPLEAFLSKLAGELARDAKAIRHSAFKMEAMATAIRVFIDRPREESPDAP